MCLAQNKDNVTGIEVFNRRITTLTVAQTQTWSLLWLLLQIHILSSIHIQSRSEPVGSINIHPINKYLESNLHCGHPNINFCLNF